MNNFKFSNNFIEEYKCKGRIRSATFDCNSTHYGSTIFEENKIDIDSQSNLASDSLTECLITKTKNQIVSNSTFLELSSKPSQTCNERITYNQLKLFDDLAIIFNLDKNSELGSRYYRLLISIYKFYNLTDLEIIYFHLFFQKTKLSSELVLEDNAYFACFFIKRILNTSNLYIFMRKLFLRYGNEESFLQKFYNWLSTNSFIEENLISIIEVNFYFEKLKELEKEKNKQCNIHLDYNKLIDSFIDIKPGKTLVSNSKHKLSLRKSSIRSDNMSTNLCSKDLLKHLSNETQESINNQSTCLYKTVRVKKRQDLKEYKILKLRETPHNPYKPILNQVDYLTNFEESNDFVNNHSINNNNLINFSEKNENFHEKNISEEYFTDSNLNNRMIDINDLLSSPLEDYLLLNELNWDYDESRI
jgi:hypothetical protein